MPPLPSIGGKSASHFGGAARHSQLPYFIKKKVEGEGGDGVPLPREEGMPAASAEVLPYQLPVIRFLFFFLKEIIP